MALNQRKTISRTMSNFIKDNKKGISIIIVIVLFILFDTCPIDLLQAVLSS